MINIIGTGIAGLSAALTLAENGQKCRLISAQQSERAQTVLAAGGINAALDTMGEDDTIDLHFEESMKGGCYLADPNAVRALTKNAPEIVKKLARIGTPFNRNEDGSIMLRNFGGQKKKRTAFAKSSTGKMIMTALIDEVRKYEERGLVTRFPHHIFIRLIIENRCCTGVCVKDSFTGAKYEMHGPVIMACGGLAGFFPGSTTGTVTNSGNAAAVLFTQGVRFADLEMIQYHPTSFSIPGKRCLLSEAARGEGGRLFSEKDGKRSYFMEERFPPLGNLMPRDVVSREMYREIRSGAETYIDMTGIADDVWNSKLSDLRDEVIKYQKLDPKEVPVPVQPAIHYFMGGIYVNEHHETSIKGLYAAGECACQYHGANRLGGNSLLGAFFGGMTAATNIYHDDTDDISEYTGEEPFDNEVSTLSMRHMGEILLKGLGIIRNEKDILNAVDKLKTLECANEIEKARKVLASAMLLSADARKESRGAHFREDHPDTDDEFRKVTVVEYRDSTVRISFENIPERRSE